VAVLAGAALGSIPSCLDRFEPLQYPYWVVDGAVMCSTVVNLLELLYTKD